ncbi:MAG: MarR family transcriptional regulator [Planctomycetota bacterium]|nr:MAG: MarR family transcriptional regulator [Planctomycetota bacterium]
MGKTKKLGEKPLALLLLHVNKLVHERMRNQMKSIGVHRGQGQVLRILGRTGVASQSELAGMMQISPPTLTNMLKSMERNGLVKRVRDTGDDRVVRVELTKLGRRNRIKADDIMFEIEKEITADIKGRDLESLHRLLRKIRDGLGGRPPFEENNDK